MVQKEKIEWICGEDNYENNGWEGSITAQYQDKLMTVILKFKEAGLEANLGAFITSQDKEEDKMVVEYLYNRNYVGIGEEFVDKMINRMKFKQTELEMIAKNEDMQ